MEEQMVFGCTLRELIKLDTLPRESIDTLLALRYKPVRPHLRLGGYLGCAEMVAFFRPLGRTPARRIPRVRIKVRFDRNRLVNIY